MPTGLIPSVCFLIRTIRAKMRRRIWRSRSLFFVWGKVLVLKGFQSGRHWSLSPSSLWGFPLSQRQPAFYTFDLNGFEIGAGQSYAIGLMSVTGLKTNLGSIRWRMCGGDNLGMGSPSGWSYESWFTSNSGGSSWGNRNSKDTAVCMEGTRLEEPVLPLPIPLGDADFRD